MLTTRKSDCVMKKVYYEETLKSGETIAVTDSYVKYQMNKKNRNVLEQVVPVKSITSVSVGANAEYNVLKATLIMISIVLWILGLLFYTDTIVSMQYIRLGIMIMIVLVGSVLFVFSLVPSKALNVCVGNKYEISISLRSFKHEKDPKQLLEAITTAIEENKG